MSVIQADALSADQMDHLATSLTRALIDCDLPLDVYEVCQYPTYLTIAVPDEQQRAKLLRCLQMLSVFTDTKNDDGLLYITVAEMRERARIPQIFRTVKLASLCAATGVAALVWLDALWSVSRCFS